MIPLSQPAKIIQKEKNKGVFQVEALYPGYGVTVGNSLRRVLLSSLGGAAITQVKIKGVPHEFATIPGVIEDVITILLNLKQLRFINHSLEPQAATLKVKGEKEVRASDFKLPSQVELVSKDVVLAHITEKSTEFEMEVQIERGIGYVAAAKDKEKSDIGVIALDAIFTPIRKVSYKVENMRVGDRTDFDRLTLEIETDGTMTPERAFQEASDILVKEFEIVRGEVKEEAPEEPKETEEKPKAKKKTVKSKKAK